MHKLNLWKWHLFCGNQFCEGTLEFGEKLNAAQFISQCAGVKGWYAQSRKFELLFWQKKKSLRTELTSFEKCRSEPRPVRAEPRKELKLQGLIQQRQKALSIKFSFMKTNPCTSSHHCVYKIIWTFLQKKWSKSLVENLPLTYKSTVLR